MNKLRLILPIMFTFIFSAGMLSPAFADTYFSVDPQVTNVSVGDTFEVKIYINGLDAGKPMIDFRFIITWDNTLMKFEGHQDNLPSGWVYFEYFGVTDDPGGTTSYFVLDAYGGPATADTSEHYDRITFKCLGPGSAPLNLPSSVTDSASSTTYTAGIAAEFSGYELSDPVKGAVNQIQSSQRPANPVGGAILPVNQLAVLAPTLALIGLVVTISTVYALKRKRKT